MSLIRKFLEEAVDEAVAEHIKERRYKRHSNFLPTDKQSELLGEIRRRGREGISLDEAKMLDWRTLNGLFSRQLIEYFPTPTGARIRAKQR